MENRPNLRQRLDRVGRVVAVASLVVAGSIESANLMRRNSSSENEPGIVFKRPNPIEALEDF